MNRLLETDANVDYMLVRPVITSRGKSYYISINGEDICHRIDRIELKNFLLNKFPMHPEIKDMMECLKTGIVDFEDGEVTLLNQEDPNESESNFLKKYTEAKIHELNDNSCDRLSTSSKTVTSKIISKAKGIMSRADKLWSINRG